MTNRASGKRGTKTNTRTARKYWEKIIKKTSKEKSLR